MSCSLQNSTASTPASCSTSRSRPTTSTRRFRPASRSCRGRPGKPGKCTIAMTGLTVPNLSSSVMPGWTFLRGTADEIDDGLIPQPRVLPEGGVPAGNHRPGPGTRSEKIEKPPRQLRPDDDVVAGRQDQRRHPHRADPAGAVVAV